MALVMCTSTVTAPTVTLITGRPSAPALLRTLRRCSAVTLHATDRSSPACRRVALAAVNPGRRTVRFSRSTASHANT